MTRASDIGALILGGKLLVDVPLTTLDHEHVADRENFLIRLMTQNPQASPVLEE